MAAFANMAEQRRGAWPGCHAVGMGLIIVVIGALAHSAVAVSAPSRMLTGSRRILKPEISPAQGVSELQVPHATSAPVAPHTIRLDIGPLRQYWPEYLGFCGEMSIQQSAAYHGHWVSQRAARWLAGGEVLISQIEGENMVPLVKRDLGFNVSHFRKVPTRDGGFKRYLVWMKDSLAANMPVIFIARIKGGNNRGYARFDSYDHIMPMYGVSTNSLAAFDPTDTFIWTSGNRNEIVRSASDPGFFASSAPTCVYNLTEGGCINNSTDVLMSNYGMAIAGLWDSYRLYLPMQLIITGWEDGTSDDKEPRDGDVAGDFALNLTRAGPFAVGESFRVYRFDMVRGKSIDEVITSGRVLGNLTSVAAVQELCVAAQDACRSHSVQVAIAGPQVLLHAEEVLGRIYANSVVFFVAVRLPNATVPVVTLG